jgi:hypothetical protein
MRSALSILALTSVCLAQNVQYISNAQVKLGVDLDKGCSITYFAAVHGGTNVINDYDEGREVQASFYSGPQGYDGCEFNGQAWSWNPIGSGDIKGHRSAVLGSSNDGNVIKCTVRPLQWACDDVPCECVFDLSYSLDGNAVISNVTLENHRSDTTDYGPYDQELPAVYVNGFLDHLQAYTGSAPWTGGPLQEFAAGFEGGKWIPGRVTPSEPWLGFSTDSGFMVAVYNDHPDRVAFLGGFAGKGGSGGSSDSQTGYMAPLGHFTITYNAVVSYSYALVMGTTQDVRAKIYEIHAGGGLN